MIIDFHAHIYPKKIAEKATENIGSFYNSKMESIGISEKLIESGSKIGVTKYIVHSTATKPEQVESINNFIIKETLKHPEFIGFGTIHKDYSDFEYELFRIKESGLKGIKLHPDFQHFTIDNPQMDEIYEEIEFLNMAVLVHAGDYRFDYSGPKRIAHVLQKHPSLKLIAAHFGGYTEWDNSMEYLVGKKVWFDTSSTLWKLPVEKANEMISKHGSEYFFFGSDFPMWTHTSEIERFNTLKLTQTEKENILYNNAESFLNELG